MTREELEHKERLRQRLEIKRKVIGEFWVEFTKYFRPWILELTRQYKERGNYPVMACWLLPSYYQNDLDKEVASFASMMIRDDDKVIDRVSSFRQLMGESPYEWFMNREFVSLSIGKNQEQRTGGVLNRKVAEYFNFLFLIWNYREKKYYQFLVNFFGEEIGSVKANLLRLILGASDGFCFGLWSIVPRYIKCPLTKDVRALLKTFFPDYVRLHDVDYAIHLFGFKRDFDFFYAALAYKDMQKRNPKGCSRLATVFQKRYYEGNLFSANSWLSDKRDGILPEIKFD